MKILTDVRFLAFYAGDATALVAVLLLAGFRQQESTSNASTSSSRTEICAWSSPTSPRLPAPSFAARSTRIPIDSNLGDSNFLLDRQSAGILFFNDEATESGGLIFGGAKGKDGKAQSYGHLSFDQYEQDQVFTIDSEDQYGLHSSAVTIWDRPDFPIGDLLATPPQKRVEFLASHPKCHARIFFGRSQDRSVGLRLKDQEGRDRIVLRVEADGTPLIQLLDKEGKITRQLPEPAIPKEAK